MQQRWQDHRLARYLHYLSHRDSSYLWPSPSAWLAMDFWCFIQAIKATEHKGSEVKGTVIRLGYGVVGLTHVRLAMTAVQLDLGSYASDRGEESSKEWTATLLAQPFGNSPLVRLEWQSLSSQSCNFTKYIWENPGWI